MVGGRSWRGNRIAVYHRDMQSSRMTARHKRLMQIRQAGNKCAPCASATHHQHAHLPFEQLRVLPANLFRYTHTGISGTFRSEYRLPFRG